MKRVTYMVERFEARKVINSNTHQADILLDAKRFFLPSVIQVIPAL